MKKHTINPISGSFDQVQNISSPLQFKGAIGVAADFPTSAAVETGWFYRVTADVTDNDGTKTNTGQSFYANDEVAWNGTDWTSVGPVTIRKTYSFIPVRDWLNGSSPPDSASNYTSGNGAISARTFANDSSEDLVYGWEVPTNIIASSGIKFIVKCLVTNATGPSNEEVEFKLSGYSIGDGDSLNGTFGDEIASNETGMTHAQYDIFMTPLSNTVTVTDLVAGETVMLKLYRDHDGNDDYGQKVGVIGVLIEYYEKITA